MRIALAVTLPLVLLLVAGCEQVDRMLAGSQGTQQMQGARQLPPIKEICFGYFTADNVRAVYKRYTPIRKYLQEQLAGVGLHISIQNKVYHSFADANDALVKGECDFFRVGAAGYVMAKASSPDIQLLAVEQNGGEKTSTAVIVVRGDSRFRAVSDLKGSTFAFGDEHSTTGRYLAQAELVKAGIHAADLEDFEYLGGHDPVARSVAEGRYDAGVISNTAFKKVGSGLRAVGNFPDIYRPWVVRAGFDKAMFGALKTALLGMKSAELLESLGGDGFLEADDNDFQFVRDGLTQAGKF